MTNTEQTTQQDERFQNKSSSSNDGNTTGLRANGWAMVFADTVLDMFRENLCLTKDEIFLELRRRADECEGEIGLRCTYHLAAETTASPWPRPDGSTSHHPSENG